MAKMQYIFDNPSRRKKVARKKRKKNPYRKSITTKHVPTGMKETKQSHVYFGADEINKVADALKIARKKKKAAKTGPAKAAAERSIKTAANKLKIMKETRTQIRDEVRLAKKHLANAEASGQVNAGEFKISTKQQWVDKPGAKVNKGGKKKKKKKKASKKKASKKKATRKKATRKKATRKKSTRKKSTRKKSTRKKSTRRKTPVVKLTKRKKRVTIVRNPGKKRRKTRRNPVFGQMGGSVGIFGKRLFGYSMAELGSAAFGGVFYGAANGLMQRFGATRAIHSAMASVPVVGTALPNFLLGVGLQWAIKQYAPKGAISDIGNSIGNGLVLASVVGMGVNASQMVPMLSPSPALVSAPAFSGYEQLGQYHQSPADFGGVDYTPMAGIDYTPEMSGVDFTMDGMGQDPADFGHYSDADFGVVPEGLG